MHVLAINCGSSTLKFGVVAVDGRDPHGPQRRLAGGRVERIGAGAVVDFSAEGGQSLQGTCEAKNHGEAARSALEWLETIGLLASGRPDAVGYRVVHGGPDFEAPTIINSATEHAIEALQDLAPLHNAPALAAMRAVGAILGPRVPGVATFDTAFHRTLPPRASHYAIPPDLADKYKIRRYGFHGLAHRSMVEQYAAIVGRPAVSLRLITLQLGSGCSIAAIERGHSIDTSMGFTPLEGLMMGTRSGDLDPSLPNFLAVHEGVDADTVSTWLNTRSGLLGVSGRSADMRELLEAEAAGDDRATLAVDMFCYRIRKGIGAYMAVLGGADAVIFGGGIGENAPLIRARICEGMDWCGIHLDPLRNAQVARSGSRINANDATVQAYVIPVNEESIIVRDTADSLAEQEAH